MSLEAAVPGQTYTWEGWQMVCCRYYTAGQFTTGKQVLEIGCGIGRGLGYLSARADGVTGGDYSPDNLRHAGEHYKGRIELLTLDACQLPFRDNSYDVIVIMEVVQYLTRFDDFLNECNRVLKDNGILCLCLPNKDSPSFHASPLGNRYYSVPELYSILEKHQFDAEMFGAFPVSGKAFWEKLRLSVIVAGGRILNLIPGAGIIKKYLQKKVLGQTIVTKPELEDSDMAPDTYQFRRISSVSPDYTHKILYAVARTRTNNGI
ncbi:class I SAM-dependent methyltransferase [Chloroflexota bacterium]